MVYQTEGERVKRPENERAAQRVVREVRSRIEAGALAPGDRLMAERHLAREFSVSRTGVREGLAILKGLGLLTLTPRGAVVRRPGLEDVAEAFSWLQGESRAEVLHMLEAREVIEARAGALAAVRRTTADLLSLELKAHQVRETVLEGADAALADTDFHRHIVTMAKNPVLTQMFHLIEDALTRGYRPIRARMLLDPTLRDAFVGQHDAIVEDLRRQDPAGAEEDLQGHIRLAVAYVVGQTREGAARDAG